MTGEQKKKGSVKDARAAIMAAAKAAIRSIDEGQQRQSTKSRSRRSSVQTKNIKSGRFIRNGPSNRGKKRQLIRRGRR